MKLWSDIRQWKVMLKTLIVVTCLFLLLFPSVLWHCWSGDRKGIWPIKICATYLQRFCSGTSGGIKLASPSSPGNRPLKWRCVQCVARIQSLNQCSSFLTCVVFIFTYLCLSWIFQKWTLEFAEQVLTGPEPFLWSNQQHHSTAGEANV